MGGDAMIPTYQLRDDAYQTYANLYDRESHVTQTLGDMLELRCAVAQCLRESGIDPQGFREYYRIHHEN